MKKLFILLILVLALLLSACGAKQNATEAPTEETVPAEAATEPEIELDPEWLTEAAIDEAVSYLFPLEGQINVQMAQEMLLPLVESGNAEAQYYWGYIYDYLIVDNTGDGEKESLYWYELSLQQGFLKAYLAAAQNPHIASEGQRNELIEQAKQAGLFEKDPEELGPDGCFLMGNYFSELNEYEPAIEWFLESAKAGNTDAENALGYFYYVGIGVNQDVDIALDWLSKAAEAGNVDAMHNYANILTNYDVAISLRNQHNAATLQENQEAADNGDPEAMYYLARRCLEEHGVLEYDFDKALEWTRKSAEAGHVEAMYFLAHNFWEEPEYWYGKAAKAGHPDAMYEYGMYLSDPVEAAEWYHKAVEAGNIDAMYRLFEIYYDGIGVEKDESIAWEWNDKYWTAYDNTPISDGTAMGEILGVAMEWYKKAADKGHAVAMRDIGYWYANHWDLRVGGAIREDAEFDWYMRAAEAGDSGAMFNLGHLYETGNYAVEQDYAAAMYWYIDAYANGYEPASERITRLLKNQQGVNVYFEQYRKLLS